jgi:hypothetical protein
MVGGVLQLAHQMAGDEDHPPLGGQRPHEATDPDDAVRVEAVHRLVEEEYGRVAQQRAGDPQPLLHAQRVAARPALGRRGEPDLVEDLTDAPLRNAVAVREPEQVVAPAPAGVHRGGVQQRADLGQRGLQRPVRPPIDERLALVRSVQAQNDPHGGGLAGAVGTDEPGDLARPDGEGEPVDRDR